MANQLENFDELLKNAFDGAEAPFNESHWTELEDELNVVSPSITGYFSAISTGIAATSLVFAVMLFMFSDVNHHERIVETNAIENTNDGEGQNYNSGSNSNQVVLLDSSKASENGSTNSDTVNSTENNSTEELAATNNNNLHSKTTQNNNTANQTQSSQDSKIEGDKNLTADQSTIKGDNANNQTVVATSTEGSSEKSNVRKGCTGLTIAFDASEEYGSNAKYLWNFGDGYFSNEATPSHTFNKEGVFDVSLSVTSSASGQITSNVVQAMIEIEEAPIANVDLEISGPNTISFNNKSYNANDVEWSLDGEIYGNSSSISMSVADNTNYSLQLSAINDGGCVDTLLTKISSIKAGSEFPRAIDPAYGIPFAPGAILDEGEVTSVKIYNQSNGELVFEGSGTKGWSGNLPTGSKADKGNYRWIMAVEQQNTIDVYHGNLELR